MQWYKVVRTTIMVYSGNNWYYDYNSGYYLNGTNLNTKSFNCMCGRIQSGIDTTYCDKTRSDCKSCKETVDCVSGYECVEAYIIGGGNFGTYDIKGSVCVPYGTDHVEAYENCF